MDIKHSFFARFGVQDSDDMHTRHVAQDCTQTWENLSDKHIIIQKGQAWLEHFQAMERRNCKDKGRWCTIEVFRNFRTSKQSRKIVTTSYKTRSRPIRDSRYLLVLFGQISHRISSKCRKRLQSMIWASTMQPGTPDPALIVC